MKLSAEVLQTKIAGRVMFYFGAIGLGLSALSIQVPSWEALGMTPLGFLKAADTCFLMCIAILLAHIAGHTGNGEKTG